MSEEKEDAEQLETKYAILMETNGEECESWYNFIKWNGNEDVLKHLGAQLKEIDMYVDEEQSTFDLELENLVSEQTAREMILVELNSVTFHRKFDGEMKPVNLGMKRKDSNDRRLKRLNQTLGMQKIEEYVADEDVPVQHALSEGGSESEHEEDEELVPMPLGA